MWFLPRDEIEGTVHIANLIDSLERHATEFQHALTLYEISHVKWIQAFEKLQKADFLSNEPRAIKSEIDTYGAWCHIAARDIVMTVFHAGKTLEALRGDLVKAPTLNAHADHDRLRSAAKAFRNHFPRFEGLRHVVGHRGQIESSPHERTKNAFSGAYEDSQGFVKMEDGIFSSTGTLTNDQFTVTFLGKVLTCEINAAALGNLRAVLSEVYSAFREPPQ